MNSTNNFYNPAWTENFIRRDIFRMSGYVPGEQPRGNELVKLNTNENPYRASAAVDVAVQEALTHGLSRYSNPTAEPFRQAVASVLDIEGDYILCGNGSDDILTILTRTFVGEGEMLRLPYPSYILYRALAQLQGAKSEEVFFGKDWSLPNYFGQAPEKGSLFRVHDNDEIGSLKLAYLPNPNSPSGTMIPVAEIEKLAISLPCPLVVDEAYVDFTDSNCIGLVRKYPNVMVTRTLSKSYSLAGLRFGFLVANPDLILQMMKVKDSYNCDSLAIAAATAAIRDQDWLHDNRKKIIATRDRLTIRMRELGFDVPDSQANFTWNVHKNPDVSHKAIYEHLKANGFLVRYMNYDRWGDGLRISVGTDEQIETCLKLVEQSLELKGK